MVSLNMEQEPNPLGLKLPPNSGQILMCDYTGFIVPEMVKKRPVIAISPRSRNGYNLVHVIPLSTSEPKYIQHYHVPIVIPRQLLVNTEFAENCWAKCDLINTVSFARLELIEIEPDKCGNRLYSHYCVSKEILFKIRKSAAKVMGVFLDSHTNV